uniref:UPF0052 protein yjiF n=1 Tax=Lygus hesperus TaxID=30085 RepID=A0A0A9X9Z9_LYGHE
MDRFLKPEKFDADPHSPTATQEWKYWLKTFENFAAAFEQIDDAGKLKLLINRLTPSVYQLIADKTTFTDAVELLKSTYVKPTNEVFASGDIKLGPKSNKNVDRPLGRPKPFVELGPGSLYTCVLSNRMLYVGDPMIGSERQRVP